MAGTEWMLERGLAFVLIIARVAGIFVMSPLLSGTGIPTRFKLFLALFLGLAAFASVPAGWATAEMSLVGVGVWAVRELLIGVAIGFVASFPITAAQLVGQIAGYQVGLALAQAFNPATNTNSGVLEAAFFYLALGIFLAAGGLEIMLLVILETFSSIPPGGLGASMLPIEMVVGVLSSGFDMALRAAAPVVVLIMIETVASAVIMRTIPSVNIMSVGFAIKIVMGLTMLALCLGVIARVLEGEMTAALEALMSWAREGPVPVGGAVPGTAPFAPGLEGGAGDAF